MRLAVSADAAIPREPLFLWWTTYDAGDHAGPALGVPGLTMRRRLLPDGECDAARFVDGGATLGAPWWYESRVTVEAPELVRERSVGSFGDFTTTYAFDALPGGRTRVTMAIEAHHPTALRAAAPLVRPLAARLVLADVDAHLADAERDLLREAKR